MLTDIKATLDFYAAKYNAPDFIESDPISIPHGFSKRQDIEISGLWTAVLAWGQRKTIISKARELVQRMDGAPHDFILHHSPEDRRRLLDFKHRTFQTTDTLYFLEFLQDYYRRHDTLETAFAEHLSAEDMTVENALTGFHNQFFSLPAAPARTTKHIATPARRSSCKRLNMFLRWMVRCDDRGVDFGLWKQLQPRQLVIPLDVHVERIARRMGLLTRPQTDWLAALELTKNLRQFDPEDPVKYDFALFGIGVLEKANGALL